MPQNLRVIAMRFVRGVAAFAVASAATIIVGGEFLEIVPDQYDWTVIGIVAPALLAIEKWLRDGGDVDR